MDTMMLWLLTVNVNFDCPLLFDRPTIGVTDIFTLVLKANAVHS